MLEMNKSKKYKEIHKSSRLINVSKKYKYKTIKMHKIY